MSFQVFSGIYSSFAQTNADSDTVFASDRWLNKTRAHVKKAYEMGGVTEEYSLAFLAATSQKNGKVVIVDFGGGLGDRFPMVAATLADHITLEFHVIDNAAACKVGRECHGDDKRIIFHESIPKNLDSAQIIHLGSVLRYIDDWQGLLGSLASFNAPHILFSDSLIGDVPTFISVENYYGEKIPFRCLNIDELTTWLKDELGYHLLYKSRFIQYIQGKKGFYNMDNMPEKYRLDSTMNLLFSKG
ncbi:MAG: methyltransferase, TIGR04325 family [Magnetococcales bacterium]|nr:methyltransferase, TIGR04325 family [Magnetococcales bacterium]